MSTTSLGQAVKQLAAVPATVVAHFAQHLEEGALAVVGGDQEQLASGCRGCAAIGALSLLAATVTGGHESGSL